MSLKGPSEINQSFVVIEIFRNITNVFIVTFDQFILLNRVTFKLF